MTCWKPNVADSAFLFHQFDTQLPLFPHWHASLLLRLCEDTLLLLHTHTHTHSITLMKVCSPSTHTLSLTSHTQTKQCYLAAVPLLMCRECWSQFFSHTQWTYVSHKQGRLNCSFAMKKKKEKKSLLHFSYGASKVSSDEPRKTRSGTRRWPCWVCLRACVQMCNRGCACDYKGRIWDALGKTNTDRDSCQQNLSYLHFLIANELPKKRLTGTDMQHGTEPSSTWRRKCFHKNIYRGLRKPSHTQALP